MCARTYDHIAREPVPETDRSRKLARIAQLEADIARLKSVQKQRQATSGSSFQPDLIGGHLQGFIDLNILPMHRADIYGHIYEANDAMVKLLGYSRDEWLTGQVRWDTITAPEYLPLDEKAIEQIKQNVMPAPWEKEYFCKDGTRKRVLVCVTAADTSGNDCFAFMIDRTAQTRLAAEIKQSEEKFRLLAEALPDMVWMADPSGQTTYHNNRYHEYTGIELSTDDGWQWLKAVHPDDRDPFLKRVDEARKTGGSFEFEYRYRSKFGEYRWHLCRGLPLKDSNGVLLKFFGTCTNIDSNKQLEQELRESELRFRTLSNAIPQIVWTAHTDGTIQFFNARWFEYTGLTYEQSENNGWQLLIHPDDLKSYLDGWRRALMTGDTYETEFRLRRAVGLDPKQSQAYKWHLCRAVALRDSLGNITKWFATWTEIEGQKNKKSAPR